MNRTDPSSNRISSIVTNPNFFNILIFFLIRLDRTKLIKIIQMNQIRTWVFGKQKIGEYFWVFFIQHFFFRKNQEIVLSVKFFKKTRNFQKLAIKYLKLCRKYRKSFRISRPHDSVQEIVQETRKVLLYETFFLWTVQLRF